MDLNELRVYKGMRNWSSSIKTFILKTSFLSSLIGLKGYSCDNCEDLKEQGRIIGVHCLWKEGETPIYFPVHILWKGWLKGVWNLLNHHSNENKTFSLKLVIESLSAYKSPSSKFTLVPFLWGHLFLTCNCFPRLLLSLSFHIRRNYVHLFLSLCMIQ